MKIAIHRLLVLTYVFFLLSTPPVLALFGLTGPSWSVWYLYPVPIAVSTVIYWVYTEGVPKIYLFKKTSWLQYGALTLVSLIFCLVVFEDYVGDWSTTIEVIVYVCILSFAQEFLFREYLVGFLKRASFSRIWTAVVSAGTFSLIHLFFPGEFLTILLAMTFGYGFLMAYIYYSRPSLLLATISHILCNLTLSATGLFW